MMTPEKPRRVPARRGRGRPAAPDLERKEKRFIVYATEAEMAAIEEAARHERRSRSEFCLLAALDRAGA